MRSLAPKSVLADSTLPGNLTTTSLDAGENTATLAPQGRSSSIEVEFT